MKRFMKLFITAACVLMFSGCATMQTLSEEFQPLEKRLFSQSNLIRENAVKEFNGLEQKEKIKILIEIAYMLKKEKDADTQVRMINALQYLTPGEYIIVPLIEAVRDNRDIHVVTSIRELIKETGAPARESLGELVYLLKDGNWEVKSLSLDVIGLMSKKAEIAVPEIVKQMQKEGRDPEKYVKIFNTLAMIDSELAVSVLIADITNKDSVLRKNAAEKLFELQAYLSPKLKKEKGIVQAFIRALYDSDKDVSEFAEKALEEIDDDESRTAVKNYLKLGKKVIKSFAAGAKGESPEKVFEEQKEKIIERIEKFYDNIGQREEFEKLRKSWE